ncbi:MAG: winged helix-turn-helix transcriptional regulator [Verrucomicrobiales bacterium]
MERYLHHLETSTPPPGTLRAIKKTAFCWQEKAVLRKIRDAFDRDGNVSSALGVYLALSETASDSGKDEFQTTHARIAEKCGFSVRTVQARLKALMELGILQIDTPELKAPSFYRLLQVRNDTQPLPNVRQRPKNSPLPTLEERKEETSEENKNIVVFSPAGEEQEAAPGHREDEHALLEAWKAAFLEAKGRKYLATPEDLRAAKALLENPEMTIERIIEVAGMAWEKAKSGGFWSKQAVSLHGLLAKWNYIRDEQEGKDTSSLKDRIETHPANQQYVRCKKNPTPEEIEDYRELKRRYYGKAS